MAEEAEKGSPKKKEARLVLTDDVELFVMGGEMMNKGAIIWASARTRLVLKKGTSVKQIPSEARYQMGTSLPNIDVEVAIGNGVCIQLNVPESYVVEDE